jgi:hypothetical protein
VPIQAIQEFVITDRSTKNYDAIKETIGANHPGLILHTAGFDDQSGVFRIVDTWETKEDAQRFYDETLGPQIQAMLANDPTATPPQRELMYELHDVIS